MPATEFDAIIIGCGPGGSSAATFLARAGKRVLALEKEIFPRFHIGESLLPANHTLFRAMGVAKAPGGRVLTEAGRCDGEWNFSFGWSNFSHAGRLCRAFPSRHSKLQA